MLRVLLYSICVSLLTTLSASRLYASDYYLKALRIYSEGKYFEASIEFERAVFYESDTIRIAQYKYYKSLCYKGMKDYIRSLEELKSIKINSVPDSLYKMICYEKALCCFLNNDNNGAIQNIALIKSRARDSLEAMYVLPLNILCLNAIRRYDAALVLWNYYLRHSVPEDSVRSIFTEELETIYRKKNLPDYLFPVKAQKLSSFIPGSGQIYCGAIIEGSLNFLINVSLLGFSIWEFYTKYYLTGYFVGLRLFNRFYAGGISRAGVLAREKNTEQLRKFNFENSNLMIKIPNTEFLP